MDNKLPGGHRSRVTPVPIPNTEVKPATADGTAAAGLWESRSLPGVFSKKARCASRASGLFLFRLAAPVGMAGTRVHHPGRAAVIESVARDARREGQHPPGSIELRAGGSRPA